MNYSAITIQGNIVTSDLLEKIRMEDIRYQAPADFGLDKHTPLRDEIGIAWAAAKAHWQAFSLRWERLKENDTGTSETRHSWMIPCLRELGYELERSNAEIINGKSYAISHRAVNRAQFPVHIVGINQSLDKRAESGGTRLSPHALVQEYLNNHDHLYALVSNGRYLRLLRDATRLSRLSFLEFDLERMMEEDLFAEFALLFRALHVTRMPESQDAGEDSIIEFYHQEALASGSRIRERLSDAVEESLKLLANGLLKHQTNENLRQHVRDGQLTANQFYLYVLRLVYRILFLLVIEERHLIYPERQETVVSGMKRSGIPETKDSTVSGIRASFPKQQEIYRRFYSINRLTQLAEKMIYVDPRKTDLWRSLLTTFRLFETAYYGEKLGIKPLGSGLFAPNALGEFTNQQLDNGTLLKVLFRLVTFEDEHKQRVRVNYADLDVEEFGSVYEGLLEYDAEFREINGQPVFAFVKGQQRSASGSHYTPEELVKPLIEHSLDYLIQERVREPEKFIALSINAQAQSSSRLKPAASSNAGALASIRSEPGALVREPEKFIALGINAQAQSSSKLKPAASSNAGALASIRFEPGALALAQEHALLSLKIADVAAGSGHILLSAARRIGLELARVRSGEDQPSPPVIRQATRDVIRHCIYGVDKNPLAVELCKVALWLEAHNPGEPLNFLDHRIKCGDAIVGLAHKEELKKSIANEAFKRLPGDEKEITTDFGKQNRKERKTHEQVALNFAGTVEAPLEKILERWQEVDAMPETAPEEITAKRNAYNAMTGGEAWWKLKTLADMQTAQFFIPKTAENRPFLVTDADYCAYLNGQKSLQGRPAAKAIAVAAEKRFFHYFLEFPEVFVQGGFDCVLGNPPFLGGLRISTHYGYHLLKYLHTNYVPAKGTCDLVGYFFRRIFTLLKESGFQSLIATNTIAQGDTREGSLVALCQNGAAINHAVRSMKWPGLAAVEVALVTLYKGNWQKEYTLDRKSVKQITSYLDDSEPLGEPNTLKQNEDKSFIGSFVFGKGFILSPKQAQDLIKKNLKNKNVLFPYLNGADLNTRPDQSPSRWVINFHNWEKDYCYENYQDCFEIVEKLVKPERAKIKRKIRREKWWKFAERAPKLYSTIEPLKKVLVIAQVSRTVAFTFTIPDKVLDAKLVVFALDKFWQFSILQSNFHHNWAWKYCTTMKTDLTYTPSAIFQTFPFPQSLSLEEESELEQIGKEYHEFRRRLMLKIQLGLTKTYNQFHNPDLRPLSETELVECQNLKKKEFSKRFGKQTWELWSHLNRCFGNGAERNSRNPQAGIGNSSLIPDTTRVPFNEAVADILHLRELHKTMDEAVLQAYQECGSEAFAGAQIELAHDFYEVDYLPENDRIRYTIHPDARKEILKRLLLLNHEIYAEEERQGLHEKKIGKKKKAARAKAELSHPEVKKTQAEYGQQQNLFE